MTGQAVISLENATKTCGGIAALAEANFELRPGEIHGWSARTALASRRCAS